MPEQPQTVEEWRSAFLLLPSSQDPGGPVESEIRDSLDWLTWLMTHPRSDREQDLAITGTRVLCRYLQGKRFGQE